MSQLTQLLASSAVLFVLVGVIVLVVLRFRHAARRDASGNGGRLSEEAFAAMAMREALAARAGSAGPGQAAGPATGAPASGSLDDIPTGILVTDEAGIVRSVNARARTLLGIEAPGTGRGFRDLLARSGITNVVDRAFRSRGALPRERVVVESAPPSDSTGVRARRTFDVEVAPVVRGGEFRGVACTIVEVTAEVAAAAIERQQQLDRQMASLASGLAHELANSLTAVHGYARMIDASRLSELDQSSLVAMQEESASMTDTLDAFRRIVRPLTPLAEPLAVTHLTDDAVSAMQAELGLGPGSVVKDVPPGIQVIGDRVLLEEALSHVIRNAVEACREANREVRVTVAARLAAEQHMAVITVRDRGIGVPEVDRGRLFEPFFSTKPNRAGFGLAYARHIVTAHGGRIDAAHPADGGVAVSMALPLAETAVSPVASR